jgi:chromosome segregation ATPase
MHIDLKELFELQNTTHDPKIIQAILENVKQSSQEGFDYLKFRYSLMNLLKMNMDVQTSIKSAYMTASTMGLNKERLLGSLAFYEGIIQKQKEDFTITLRSQILKNIDGPKAELQKLDHLREENMRKIAALQREIDGIEDKKTELHKEIEESESKIEKRRSEFKAVVDHLDTLINKDKSLFIELL